jgi:hypothetical protein
MECLPHAPATDRYILIKDEAGRLLHIDADLDYLFLRDDGRMTRRVWTENGVTYVEDYSPHTILFGEGEPVTVTLDRFVYCAWRAIEKPPGHITGFTHKDGINDFRMNNLVPTIDPDRIPKKKKRKAA